MSVFIYNLVLHHSPLVGQSSTTSFVEISGIIQYRDRTKTNNRRDSTIMIPMGLLGLPNRRSETDYNRNP